MFDCKCCQVLKDENTHLRGLVDRLMRQIAPKAEDSDFGNIEQRVPEMAQSEENQEVYGVG